MKILFIDYELQFAIIELLGESYRFRQRAQHRQGEHAE